MNWSSIQRDVVFLRPSELVYAMVHTRLTMYYFRLFLYSIITVSLWFSRSFSMECIGCNINCFGAVMQSNQMGTNIVVVLVFYGPSTLLRSFRVRSVNLSTLFLGKLPRRFTSTLIVHILSPVTDKLPFLNQRAGENDHRNCFMTHRIVTITFLKETLT